MPHANYIIYTVYISVGVLYIMFCNRFDVCNWEIKRYNVDCSYYQSGVFNIYYIFLEYEIWVEKVSFNSWKSQKFRHHTPFSFHSSLKGELNETGVLSRMH